MLGCLGVIAACVVVQPESIGPLPNAGQDTRPILHFTPEKNWTNDPNGLIWVDGEYHLFHQYNPFGDQWGHMSWGHSVSKDLITWEHLPVAIPEADGVMAFSGTCVFDRGNSSGFGTTAIPPMVAIYTGHDERRHLQYQNLAYSTDRGRTWTPYAGNPVIDLGVAEFRDPKVFWHEPTHRWIMVVSLAADRRVLFYASDDLKKWTKLSEFGPEGRGGVPNWECPDLFELPVAGDAHDTRWVLVINVGGNGPLGGSGCQYFIGRFDGQKFVNENKPDQALWLDQGKDFYAFQSFQDAPGGKRIGLAWMVNTPYAGATPTSPWRGSMTIPREYRLMPTPDGIRIAQMPIEGVETYLRERGARRTAIEPGDIGAGVAATQASGEVGVIEAEFDAGSTSQFGVRVREGGPVFTAIGYDPQKKQIFIDRRHSGRVDFHPDFPGNHVASMSPTPDGHIKLKIVLDRGSVEVFGNDGIVAMTSLIFPPADAKGISLFSEGGAAKLVRFESLTLGGR